MQDVLLKYGLPGICILALAYYIINLEERHRKERKEMRDQQDKENIENRKIQQQQFERLNEMSDTSNQVTRENTNILIGLKTLLENQRK